MTPQEREDAALGRIFRDGIEKALPLRDDLAYERDLPVILPNGSKVTVTVRIFKAKQ